ncbi:hypothetical protein DL546_005059 [Coniochaeta pulveracea]|uniref:EXPERA domain-containing protein n=1 Tax=Coniochaeta pulveracea TaxID=177199 RepID=A0A420Y319_9PEZI|nr:hypothetical protein DL546_005059 [Coniochaeta pulveracea]
MTASTHPYYPEDASIPSFAPNTAPIPVLLGTFGGLIAVVVLTSLSIAKRLDSRLSTYDQLVFCWFVLCGFLHLFFEGYFVLKHASIPASQSLFAQLWKEYALSDSRYMVSDPFMLCIESLTVVLWGPLCVAIAISIAKGSSLRTPLQIIMCVGHLYGVLLYFGTCFYETHFRGINHSRPETLYYWGYFVGMNFPWVVVPSFLLKQSVVVSYRAILQGGGDAIHQTERNSRPKKD